MREELPALWKRPVLGKGTRGKAQAPVTVDSEEQKRQRVTRGPKRKTGKHMCDSGWQWGGQGKS